MRKTTIFEEAYSLALKVCELDMCKDLWTWIDSGLLLSDDILSDMGWNNFKEE